MNWYVREKMKGQLTKEKLEERLSHLLRKKDMILELNKPQRWQYYRKSLPDVSKLEEEIKQIEQQLSTLSV